jgi:enoyl-CoA hydratase/carnithine racemase
MQTPAIQRRPHLEGEFVIPEGCTDGWVELSRTASGVYIVSMLAQENPENRWVSGLTAAMMKAHEAIEAHLETKAGNSPAALLTVSENPKFFSNGIDPDGMYAKRNNIPPPLNKEDQIENGFIGMPSFFRPLQLPIPTVAAINGHAFGAGMMFAVAHDYRLQRKDKGFMCAVEIAIGAAFPTPEKFLFQHVMSKPNAQRTMLGAKRWDAQSSLAADLIEEACSVDELFPKALAFAESQAQLAKGKPGRKLFMTVKNQLKGHVMKSCMNFAFPDNKFPASLESNFPSVVENVKKKYPNFVKHIGETLEELPNGEFMAGTGRYTGQDEYDTHYDNYLGKPRARL